MKRNVNYLAAPILAAACFAGAAWADGMVNYEVRITNVTRGTLFTPILVAAHKDGAHLYQLGMPPSDELAAIAESGNTAPMAAKLSTMPTVGAVTRSAGPVLPGTTAVIPIEAKEKFDHVSLAGMLVPTNDGFVALNNVPLPIGGEVASFLAIGHDAGSEPNDESCANVPGPFCGGIGLSPGEGGEGYVHVHAGIHGIGDLHPDEYDWRNPVAHVTIRRVPK